MNEMMSDKTRRGSTPITVLGITVLALLMLVSIAATADNVAAAGTDNKVIKDYTPNYENCAVIHIMNAVGSDIVVSWAKAGSKEAVFQVNIPKGQTRRVTAPAGSYDQYVHTGGFWYEVTTGRIVAEYGYEYTIKYYLVIDNTIKYDGTGFKRIPDSEAPKV